MSKKTEYADLFWLIGVFLGAVATGVSICFEKEAYCGMLCPLFGIIGLNIGNLMKKRTQENRRRT